MVRRFSLHEGRLIRQLVWLFSVFRSSFLSSSCGPTTTDESGITNVSGVNDSMQRELSQKR